MGKSVKKYNLYVIFLGIVLCAAVFYINIYCGIITALLLISVAALYNIYIKNIYREMSDLSDYMTEITTAAENLEIRDNCEGELSLLKNNIYKTAKKLKSQSELLLKDKTWLADSLADVSHQLKTPITSMMVMMDLLRDEELPSEKKKEFLMNINTELEKMQWLIITLLKLSKFDAGTVDLKEERVNAKEIVQDALTPFMIMAEIKGIEIKENLSDAYFAGDFAWSVEAVGNIIKNCLEHTKEGGMLKVETVQSALATVITIEDNGSGIEKEDLPHIFERFYKGKNSSQNSVGIGLALSKSVFNREKGVVDVQSEINKGSKFIIKFYSNII